MSKGSMPYDCSTGQIAPETGHANVGVSIIQNVEEEAPKFLWPFAESQQ